MEWFHHLQNILELWVNLIIFSLSSLTVQLFILYFFTYIVFLFIKCIMNAIIKHVVFQSRLNTLTLMCLKFCHIVEVWVVFSPFFNIMQIYWYAMIYPFTSWWIYELFIHLSIINEDDLNIPMHILCGRFFFYFF